MMFWPNLLYIFFAQLLSFVFDLFRSSAGAP
jgi:hypothetical protein